MAASNFSIASFKVFAGSVPPVAFVILKVGPVTVPFSAIVVPPMTVAKLPTAANLPFVASDKSTVYARTLLVSGVALLIVNASLPTATVVSIAFTL